MKAILFLLFLVFSCKLEHDSKIKSIMSLASAGQTSEIQASFTVSGTISGLSSNSITISLNGSEQLTLSSDGVFTFSTKLFTSNSYSVSIKSLPTGKYCSLSNQTGTIQSDVKDVSISCADGTSSGPLVGGSIFNPLSLSYQVTTLGSGGSYNGINGVSTDGTYIYTANGSSHTVNKFDPTASAYSVLAGQLGSSGNTDAIGTAARFNNPYGIVYLGGYLYITDNTNSRIRRINLSDNSVTTIATGLASPYGITTDGNYLYITVQHEIKRIDLSNNTVTSLAGSTAGYLDGVGASAKFNITASTGSITYDGTNLYIADNNNCAIRKVTTSSGTVTTIVGSAPPTVSCTSTDGVGTSSARLASIDGIASDGTNIYFSETVNCIIRKITMSSLTVSTVIGQSGSCSLLDGNGTAARLKNPALMTSDGLRLYVADWGNNALRKIE